MSGPPSVSLEHWLERWLGDIEGVIGYRRGGADRQRFQRLVRFEAGGKKGLNRRIAYVAPLFDEVAGVSREGRGTRLPRPAALADRLTSAGLKPAFRAR